MRVTKGAFRNTWASRIPGHPNILNVASPPNARIPSSSQPPRPYTAVIAKTTTMAGITDAAPSAATIQSRPGKRRLAKASASAVPSASDRMVESAAWAREKPSTRVRYGPTERRSDPLPAAENSAPKPPATRSAITRATKAPGGGRVIGAARSLGCRIQPFVGERPSVLLNVLGGHEERLGGLDQIVERGRQPTGRGLDRKHPIALRHGGL